MKPIRKSSYAMSLPMREGKTAVQALSAALDSNYNAQDRVGATPMCRSSASAGNRQIDTPAGDKNNECATIPNDSNVLQFISNEKANQEMRGKADRWGRPVKAGGRGCAL